MEKFNIIHVRKRKHYSPGNVCARGGVTIAWNYEDIKKDGKQNSVKISFGIAICMDEDAYNKFTGRELAISRTKENMFVVPSKKFYGMTDIEKYNTFLI